MIIAVDGPAASGKGTLASGLARHYNLPYLDTGLLYRAVGRAVEAYENAPEFEARAIAAAQSLDEDDIEPEFLLSAKVGTLASKVAVIGEVRAALFDYQRQFALQEGGAVLARLLHPQPRVHGKQHRRHQELRQARHNRQHMRGDQPHVVGERHPAEHCVACRDLGALPHVVEIRHEIAVCDDDPLGVARRSR